MSDNVPTGEPAGLSDERLAEILAGCDGVTPGRWDATDRAWPEQIGCCPLVGRPYSLYTPRNHRNVAAANTFADAAHIARLDPDTVRSLVTELQARRRSPAPAADGFDAADLDMIRRGDRLGPTLGQKVYAALSAPVSQGGVTEAMVEAASETLNRAWHKGGWVGDLVPRETVRAALTAALSTPAVVEDRWPAPITVSANTAALRLPSGEEPVRRRMAAFAAKLESSEWTAALWHVYHDDNAPRFSYDDAKAAFVADLRTLDTQGGGDGR